MLRPACFATFSEEEILAANKAVLPTSTRKRQVWLMSLSTFRYYFAAKRSPEPLSIKTKIKHLILSNV